MRDNLYEILGVDENASKEEIKTAYRNLVKIYHPDKGGDENLFKKISNAYEVLGNEQKRQQYNQQKNNPYGGTSFEEMFSQMFGGQNPFEQRRQPSAPSKIVKIKVSPIESLIGSEKNISYIKESHCNSCGGSGGDQQKCNGCGGAGFKLKTFGTGFMVQQVRTACEVCGGKGFTLIHRCVICAGRGTKTEKQEVNIKLPEGIDNGQYMKLQGYGDFSNGVYGDLVIQVEVEPKDDFEKINNDLIYNLFLNLDTIKNDVIKTVFTVQIKNSTELDKATESMVEDLGKIKNLQYNQNYVASGETVQVRLVEYEVTQVPSPEGPKIGRNDPCHCGSGKKYKRCHGKIA
jgi:molecular chaperone DnaJ